MTSKGGCGCGGGSGSVAVTKGCGCGGACGGACGCEISLKGEGFVRPRFFSGMLLTEDDLQGIVDYTLAKRRLTNRHVFGPGVVCGLDVTCHPCETGSVIVSPGYAIECCGNDIYVSCPEEVDILALVRDLRRREGVECGEPCEDFPHQDYYLFVRYVEQPTAPVAPYASDDCVIGDCEFSRVREGYCFELRCELPEPEPSYNDIVRECRGDDRKVREDASRLAQIVRHATAYANVVERAAAGAEVIPDIPTKSEFDELSRADELDLTVAFDVLRRSTLTLAMDAASKKGNAPSPRLNSARRDVISGGSHHLARRVLDSAEYQSWSADERARVERILATAEEQPDLSETTAFDRAWLAEGLSEHEVRRSFVADAEAMRGHVLQELTARGRTHCEEYRAVSQLQFDTLHSTSKEAALILGRSYLRTISDCACGAFNPPCLTCTDPAVPLARVRVEDCDVTDICALDRHWVLSPRAAAYWLDIHDTFGLLARYCCDGYDRDYRPTDRLESAAPTEIREMAAEAALVSERRAMRSTVSPLASTPILQPEASPELVELVGALGLPTRETRFAAAVAQPRDELLRSLELKVVDLEKRIAELSTEGEGGNET